LWVSRPEREESVDEVDIFISCLDGLFEVDDGNPVNGEGAFIIVDDAVEDGFDAVVVGRLVTPSVRGVDGKSDDDEMACDLGGRVQTRPSMRRRVWVCESAVVLLVMSIKP
jgi:hypothetical protein